MEVKTLEDTCMNHVMAVSNNESSDCSEECYRCGGNPDCQRYKPQKRTGIPIRFGSNYYHLFRSKN